MAEFLRLMSQFQTTDQKPDPNLVAETDRMLDEVLLTLKLERAVIFLKLDQGWSVASAHEVETNDFWTLAPLSLSVVEDAATSGETLNLMDAGNSDKFGGRDSVILTGIRSVACASFKDASGQPKALLYADNRIEKGAFSPDDVATLEELAQELGRRIFG